MNQPTTTTTDLEAVAEAIVATDARGHADSSDFAHAGLRVLEARGRTIAPVDMEELADELYELEGDEHDLAAHIAARLTAPTPDDDADDAADRIVEWIGRTGPTDSAIEAAVIAAAALHGLTIEAIEDRLSDRGVPRREQV